MVRKEKVMPNLYRCENNNIMKRGEKKSPPKNNSQKKKKLNFKTCKNNTLCSLNEVEHFLNNFNSFIKYVKLYKMFR